MKWASISANCNPCSPNSTASNWVACASSLSRRQRRRSHRLHPLQARGNALLPMPPLGGETSAGAGYFRIAGKRTTRSRALLLRRTHHERSGSRARHWRIARFPDSFSGHGSAACAAQFPECHRCAGRSCQSRRSQLGLCLWEWGGEESWDKWKARQAARRNLSQERRAFSP